MITQLRSSAVPPMLKFMPKRLSGAKSGSPSKRLATLKNDKVDSTTKMVPKPSSFAAGTDSPAEKKETARASDYEKSTKSVYQEVAEIYTPLRPNMVEDMDVYTKFVDGVK
ncbi:hypothetical protein ACFX2J_003776 [Malus domestica]